MGFPQKWQAVQTCVAAIIGREGLAMSCMKGCLVDGFYVQYIAYHIDDFERVNSYGEISGAGCKFGAK
jgi:hypothetical protein